MTAEQRVQLCIVSPDTDDKAVAEMAQRATRFFREKNGSIPKEYQIGDPVSESINLSMAIQDPRCRGGLRAEVARQYTNLLNLYSIVSRDPQSVSKVIEAAARSVANGSFPFAELRRMVSDSFEEKLKPDNLGALGFMLSPNSGSATGLNLTVVYVPKDILDLT